jgi:hypothetical protein
LKTFDRNGVPIDREAGIQAIDRAIHWVEEHGFDASKLRENIERLTANPLPQYR